MDPASGMENAFGRPGGQRRQGTRFPHRFGRRTRRAAHRLHRVIICMHKHDNASRISKTRDDHDGRRLTDTRRFAPTSVHLRRNRRSRSSESVFNFSGIRTHGVRVMPTNRAVLLITRGNEPVPGMRTEDPGALYIYGFENGQLTNKQSVAPNQGLAYRVRHADFHPTGRWVYVDLEAQNLLHTYSIRADDTLSEEPVFVSTTLASPSTSRGGQTTSSIRMHPTNGRILYVANRGRGTEVFQGERVANGTEKRYCQ